MADKDLQPILRELQNLNKTLAKTGSNQFNSRTEALRERAGVGSGAANNSREETIHNATKRKMEKSVDGFVRSIALTSRSVSDFDKRMQRINKRSDTDIKAFAEMTKGIVSLTDVTKEQAATFRKLGFEVEDAIKSEADLTKERNNAIKSQKQYRKEIETAMDKIGHTGPMGGGKGGGKSGGGDGDGKSKGGFFTGAAGKVGTAFAGAGVGSKIASEMLTGGANAMKFGVDPRSTIDTDTLVAGMMPAELIEVQGQYRSTIESLGMSLEQFNEGLASSALSLVTYTGNLKDAALLSAESAKVFRDIGGMGGLSGMDAFTKAQAETFKNLNRSVSMTAEQFNAVTAGMVESENVQQMLFKLDKSKRAGYIQEQMLMYTKLRNMNLENEEAARVIDTLAKINGQDGKSRLKQAAGVRAIAGSLGMSQEGNRLAELMLKKNLSADEKAEQADIMTTMSRRTSDEMAGSLGQEMSMQARLDKSGLTDLIGPNSEFAKVAMRGEATADRDSTGIVNGKVKEDGFAPNALPIAENSVAMDALTAAVIANTNAQNLLGMDIGKLALAVGTVLGGGKLLNAIKGAAMGADAKTTDKTRRTAKKGRGLVGRAIEAVKGTAAKAAPVVDKARDVGFSKGKVAAGIAIGATAMVAPQAAEKLADVTENTTTGKVVMGALDGGPGSNVATVGAMIPGVNIAAAPYLAGTAVGGGINGYLNATPERSHMASEIIGGTVDSLLDMIGLGMEDRAQRKEEADAELKMLMAKNQAALERIAESTSTSVDELKKQTTAVQQGTEQTTEELGKQTDILDSTESKFARYGASTRRPN